MAQESASGTFVRSPSDPPITDSHGNEWTLSARGQAVIDGQTDPTTHNVTELAYFNRQIWQWVQTLRLWWHKDSPLAPWLPTNGTPDAPFGPTPDPRLDAIQVTIGIIQTEQQRIAGVLASAIQNVQNDVDEIPREMIPDPRVDTIVSALTQLATETSAGFRHLNAALFQQSGEISGSIGALQGQLDAITNAFVSDQATLNDLADQVHRIVVMLLDLFPTTPPPAKPKITAHLAQGSSEGSQTAPSADGP